MERWWWLISKKIAFSSSGHSSLDRTSSSISLSKRHTICICTHTLLPLFTVAQLLSVLVDVSRCTHSLIQRYRGLFCLRQQRWGLPDWSQSLWVWMNGWLVTVQDGSLTVISLCTLNFILTFSTSCGFSLPKRPLRIVLFLCYTDTEWQHDRFNSTPNTQLLSCLFVVNFVYFIIPGRGNKALYCNPYVYSYVQDEKS